MSSQWRIRAGFGCLSEKSLRQEGTGWGDEVRGAVMCMFLLSQGSSCRQELGGGGETACRGSGAIFDIVIVLDSVYAATT